MGSFKTAYTITSVNEGGWHNGKGKNKWDRGGETFKGIARKIWPDWDGWKLIDNWKTFAQFPFVAENDPKINEAVHLFYKKNFWDKNRLDEIEYQPLCNELYDTGVNFGTNRAAKMLQQSLNLLNRAEASWKDIKEDGIIGNITLGIVNKLSAKDSISCFNLLNVLQGEAYLNIARKDKTQENNLRGWLTRVELMRFGLALI